MGVTEADFKKRIAENLVRYRKASGLTQLEVAERLNYSDKSVSKWERGEGTPELFVLMQIAELYGISVNELLSSETAKPVKTPKLRGRRRAVNTIASAGIAWLVATVIFFIEQFFDLEFRSWLVFIYAIPVSAIVLVVFTSIWSGRITAFLTRALLYWGIALSLHLTFINYPPLVYIYIVAAAVQVLDFIWFFRKPLKKQ